MAEQFKQSFRLWFLSLCADLCSHLLLHLLFACISEEHIFGPIVAQLLKVKNLFLEFFSLDHGLDKVLKGELSCLPFIMVEHVLYDQVVQGQPFSKL